MKVVGLDPAFANFGMVAGGLFQLGTGWVFRPGAMELMTTQGAGGQRVVRKSSETLERGQQLHRGLHNFLHAHKPELVFVEVPSGAQNSAAAAGLGVAIGVLASIHVPIIEVAPMEIKRLFTNRKEKVPKKTVISWAYACWPGAEWITTNGKRTLANEHLADACATVVAGIKTPTFLQLMAMMSSKPQPITGRQRVVIQR